MISGDCVYSRRQFTGHNNDGVYVPLNNAVGSVWEQLKTIDKMNDELGGDLEPPRRSARHRTLEGA